MSRLLEPASRRVARYSALSVCRNCAPRAPSTTRWSTASVQLMMLRMTIAPLRTTTLSSPAPTARIIACGVLMMAPKSRTPNMPRFEIVKPPPWNSSSFSLPLLARLARSFISIGDLGRALHVGVADDRRDQRRDRWRRPRKCRPRRTGSSRPRSTRRCTPDGRAAPWRRP